jgi:hypothetical protein
MHVLRRTTGFATEIGGRRRVVQRKRPGRKARNAATEWGEKRRERAREKRQREIVPRETQTGNHVD